MKNFKNFFKKEEDLSNKTIVKLDTKELLDSIPVENYRNVLDYMVNGIERSIRLTKKSKEEFTTIFGKYNTTFRGEFFNYIWIVQFENEVFQIFTSNRGTQFAIVTDDSEVNKSEVCISFLKKMEELLNNIEK
jgi:hypothetical protein